MGRQNLLQNVDKRPFLSLKLPQGTTPTICFERRSCMFQTLKTKIAKTQHNKQFHILYSLKGRRVKLGGTVRGASETVAASSVSITSFGARMSIINFMKASSINPKVIVCNGFTLLCNDLHKKKWGAWSMTSLMMYN